MAEGQEVIELMLKAGTLEIRLAKGALTGIKSTVALLNALYSKYHFNGQVGINSLKSRYNCLYFQIDESYRDVFKAEARKIRMPFAIVRDDNPLVTTIAIPAQEEHNFNYIISQIGTIPSEADREKFNDSKDIKDDGFIERNDGREENLEYVVTHVSGKQDNVAFQKYAANNDIKFVSGLDIDSKYKKGVSFCISSSDYVKFRENADKNGLSFVINAKNLFEHNEVSLSEVSRIIERNKNNSAEAGAIYMTYWPMLQKEKEICCVSVSNEQYARLKNIFIKGVPFSAVKEHGDNVTFLFGKDNSKYVQDIIPDAEIKKLVRDSEIQTRLIEKGHSECTVFINISDAKKCGNILTESNIKYSDIAKVGKIENYFKLDGNTVAQSIPYLVLGSDCKKIEGFFKNRGKKIEFQNVGKDIHFFENLQHRRERVSAMMGETSEQTKEKTREVIKGLER